MLVDNFSIDIRKGGDWEKRDVCGDIHQVCQRAGCFSGYSGGYGENGQTAEGSNGGFLYDKPWESPEEIQYAAEAVRAMFRLKSSYLDRG